MRPPLVVRIVLDASLPGDGATLREVGEAAAASRGACVEWQAADGEGELVAYLAAARRDSVPAVVLPGHLASATVAESAGETVWLELDASRQPKAAYLVRAQLCAIRGRGLGGLVWAVRSALARSRARCSLERYGPEPDQVGDLWLPDPARRPFPVCVLLHGGHWRDNWERDLMDELAAELSGCGYACWNLEYRRVGPSGGGWPATFADVASGLGHLSELARRHPLDLGRVVAVGHSAGAQLAMWATARRSLPRGAPGACEAADALIDPALVVSLAGVPDLVHSARLGIDHRAVEEMMGGSPASMADAYRLASPAERLPLGAPCVLVWGSLDSPDLIEENRLFVQRALRAGQGLDVLELRGADHFSVIDPASPGWQSIADLLETAFAPAPPTGE